ncbi:ribbon-helix-helix protein, CopG family [Bifidobacterium pseudolongum]|uniref:ribbon-helix-helix protein, CopG family n=1 Tax=Bifidobacterium pseudolongum TaxID=1694 RepID=UPI00102004B0|nr:ribbon-helix-helix protein, CopG family [Bifidobacterium pseudolongum]
MVIVSVRLPKATVDSLNQQARRYHISRSEYMRRRLARPDSRTGSSSHARG